MKLSNVPLDKHLLQFGEFIVPDLLKVFKHLINPDWRTLDLLENVEGTMHKAVRVNNPGATPPELKINRIDNNTVQINYYSKRNLPDLARGIIIGIAKQYKEEDVMTISQKEAPNSAGWIFTIKKGIVSKKI